MNPFKLYYLVDQAGPIDGEKVFMGNYADLASAKAQAATDAVAHYSVEQSQDDGATFSIVFIT